jgi:putative transposase
VSPIWGQVILFFAFSPRIRRVIYTPNVIEPLQSKLSRAVRMHGHFPGDEAAMQPP